MPRVRVISIDRQQKTLCGEMIGVLGKDRSGDGGGRGWPSPAWVATVGAVAFVCLCVMDVYHVHQCALMQNRLYLLETRLQVLEEALSGHLSVALQKGRGRRSVVAAPLKLSAAGIAIVDQPYGHKPQHTGASHRLLSTYDDFDGGSHGRRGSTENPSIQPHHRSSAAFVVGTLGRVNTGEDGDDSPDPTPPTGGARHQQGTGAPRRARVHSSRPATRRPADAMAHRRSRVPTTKRRKVRQRKQSARRRHRHKARRRQQLEARVATPGYAEPPAAPQALRQADQRHRSKHRSTSSGGHSRGKRLQRLAEQLREEMSATAAHFEGHTSNYSRLHPHYGGNGLLRNVQPDAVFVDWRPAEWMHQQGFSQDFTLYGGQVTVKRPGVYHIYAQINYLDDSDINGFEIVVNRRSLTKCLTMEASDQRQKANTCYTAASSYLDTGDTVVVRDLESHRISMLLPDRSFFGMMKLAGTGGPDTAHRDDAYF